MYWTAYSLLIKVFGFLIRVSALWSEKSRLWINGRSNQLIPDAGDSRPLWFHVASLGEFEQARPIIEKIKAIYPDLVIYLSFFSPSGYEIRKNYSHADVVFYLPLDTGSNAQKLMSQINPSAIIFTKYDLWFNLIIEAQKNEIPCFLISAIFRPGQIYFKLVGRPMLKKLKAFKGILTQDKETFDLLTKYGFSNQQKSSDTRIDRVLTIQQESYEVPQRISDFIGGHNILILGSTWQEDEDVLLPYLKSPLLKNWKIIVAPHDVSKQNIIRLQRALDLKSGLLSEEAEVNDERVFIIDCIGILNKLYRLGDVAYIGGGFGKGIHNTLEPAAAGLPVIFGPNYQKFNEAQEMIKAGTGFCITKTQELRDVMMQLKNTEVRKGIRALQKDFIIHKAGATSDVIDLLVKSGIIP